MRTCKNCGSNALDTDKYCQVCGGNLDRQEQDNKINKSMIKKTNTKKRVVKQKPDKKKLNIFDFFSIMVSVLAIILIFLMPFKVALVVGIIALVIAIISFIVDKKFKLVMLIPLFALLLVVFLKPFSDKAREEKIYKEYLRSLSTISTSEVKGDKLYFKTNNLRMQYNYKDFRIDGLNPQILKYKDTNSYVSLDLETSLVNEKLDINNEKVLKALVHTIIDNIKKGAKDDIKITVARDTFVKNKNNTGTVKINFEGNEKNPDISGIYHIILAPYGDYLAVFKILSNDKEVHSEFVRSAEAMLSNVQFFNSKKREKKVDKPDKDVKRKGNMTYKLAGDWVFHQSAKAPCINTSNQFYKYGSNPVYLSVQADSLGGNLSNEKIEQTAKQCSHLKIISRKRMDAGGRTWQILETEAFEYERKIKNQVVSNGYLAYRAYYYYDKANGTLYQFTLIADTKTPGNVVANADGSIKQILTTVNILR